MSMHCQGGVIKTSEIDVVAIFKVVKIEFRQQVLGLGIFPDH